MAYFFAGWETGDKLEAFTNTGTTSVVTSPTRGSWSTYALRCNPTTTATGSATLGVPGVTGAGAAGNFVAGPMWVRVYVRFATLPASGDEELLNVTTSLSAARFTLRINSAGNLAAYDATPTLLGTGTAVLTTGVWYRIEMKVGTGATTDPFASQAEWYIATGDGAKVLDGSVSYTPTSGNNGSLIVGKNTNRNGNTVDFFFDDVAISSLGYPGPGQCTALTPSAAGTYQTATVGAGGGTHPASLAHRPPQQANFYLLTDLTPGDAETETFTTTTASAITGRVFAAKLTLNELRDAGTNGSFFLRLRSGGSNFDSASATSSASGQLLAQRVYLTDPATGNAWTNAALDGVEGGAVENSAAGKTRMVTLLWQVDYDPGTPVPGAPGPSAPVAPVAIGGTSIFQYPSVVTPFVPAQAAEFVGPDKTDPSHQLPMGLFPRQQQPLRVGTWGLNEVALGSVENITLDKWAIPHRLPPPGHLPRPRTFAAIAEQYVAAAEYIGEDKLDPSHILPMGLFPRQKEPLRVGTWGLAEQYTSALENITLDKWDIPHRLPSGLFVAKDLQPRVFAYPWERSGYDADAQAEFVGPDKYIRPHLLPIRLPLRSLWIPADNDLNYADFPEDPVAQLRPWFSVWEIPVRLPTAPRTGGTLDLTPAQQVEDVAPEKWWHPWRVPIFPVRAPQLYLPGPFVIDPAGAAEHIFWDALERRWGLPRGLPTRTFQEPAERLINLQLTEQVHGDVLARALDNPFLRRRLYEALHANHQGEVLDSDNFGTGIALLLLKQLRAGLFGRAF